MRVCTRGIETPYMQVRLAANRVSYLAAAVKRAILTCYRLLSQSNRPSTTGQQYFFPQQISTS
jgi:hypothetical protein